MRPRLSAVLLVCLMAALATTSTGRASHTLGRVDRSTVDRPDETVGPQIHAVYAVPSDGQDNALDTRGVIGAWLENFNAWLAGQTGGVTVRVDTFQGQPDVSFIRLKETDATLANQGGGANATILNGLLAAGFNDPNKKYVVFEEGGNVSACGLGGGPIAVMYLQGTPSGYGPCAETSWAMLMGHELFHTFGIVNTCAPHATPDNHVTDDPNDLMSHYLPANPVLDPGHDDYYGPPGDNHLPASCPPEANLANSLFLSTHPFYRLAVGVNGHGVATAQQTGSTNLTQCTVTTACALVYPATTSVTLTAAADPGFHFVGWNGGACSGTRECQITMTSDMSVTATFSPDPYLTLRIKGKGHVTVSGLGSCAKARCALQLPYGQHTSIRALPARGWRFLGWSGACRGKSAVCGVASTADSTVTATFAAKVLRVCRKGETSTITHPCRS